MTQTKLGTLRHNPDYPLLVTVAVLVIFGVVMVYSASYVIAYRELDDPHYFFVRQMAWVGLGTILMLALSRVNYHWWAKWATWGLIAIVIALLVTQFTPLGIDYGGARRWLRLGPPPIPALQPSDFAKLVIIVFLAAFLGDHPTRTTEIRRGLLPFIGAVGLLAGLLVIAQRDLGTTVIVLVIATTVFFVGGADLWYLGAIGIIGTAFALSMAAVEPYRWQRIATFLNPFQDTQGSGYQIAHILMALGSGGLTGQGLGASREKFMYLPGTHTDSIFAVVGEELGLIGCLAVIALFAVFAYRGYQVALRAPDRLGFLMGTGITTWITFQAFVNLAGATNTLPLTGVPLPFISSGGSSMIACLMGVGVLLNISRHRAGVVEAPASPAPRPAVTSARRARG